MPPLYPKMRERPEEFRLNPRWPTFHELLASALGGRQLYPKYVDMYLEPYGYPESLSPIEWNNDLGRMVYSFPASINLESWRSTRQGFYVIPPVSTSLLVYQRSARTRVSVCELGTEDGYWAHSPQLNRVGEGQISAYWANTSGGDYTYVDSEGGIVTFYRWHGVGVRYTPLAQCIWNGTIVAQSSGTSGSPRQFFSLILGMAENSLDGFIADVLVWQGVISLEIMKAVQDPSNVDLRIGGIPLILPPRRRFWPVVSEQALPKMVPWHLFQQVGV